MKVLNRVGALLLVISSGAIAGFAQEPPSFPQGGGGPPGGGMRMQMQMPTFAELDKNKDKKLTKDEIPQMPPQFFERLDENKDGAIDEEEFGRMRGGRGGPGGPRTGEILGRFLDADQDTKVTREEFAKISQLFDSLDKDGNGELAIEELNRFFEAVREAQTQATGGVEVNNLFDKFDKNKDGKIASDEMAGQQREFKALDLNEDGSLTRQEVDQALKKLAEASRQKKAAKPSPEK
jgi:Ca2+-binding EF-hand superfamily protein